MKNSPDISIVPFEDMNQLDDEGLRELAEKEREWFGYEGFGEYAVCSDPECRRVLSIDEVYGTKDTNEQFVSLKELEKDGPKLPDCSDCHNPTEILMQPELFIKYLRWAFQKKTFGALLKVNGKIEGEALFAVGRLQDLFNENLNYQFAYNYEEFMRNISDLAGRELTGDEEFVCGTRLGVSRPYRGLGNFAEMNRKALELHPKYDDLPKIGGTRIDSALFPLTRAIGYEPILPDGKGGVSLYLDKTSKFREALSLQPDEFKRVFGPALEKHRLSQAQYVKEHLEIFAEPKRVVGVPLLPEILEAISST